MLLGEVAGRVVGSAMLRLGAERERRLPYERTTRHTVASEIAALLLHRFHSWGPLTAIRLGDPAPLDLALLKNRKGVTQTLGNLEKTQHA